MVEKEKEKVYTWKYTKRMSASNGFDNSTRNFGQYPEGNAMTMQATWWVLKKA